MVAKPNNLDSILKQVSSSKIFDYSLPTKPDISEENLRDRRYYKGDLGFYIREYDKGVCIELSTRDNISQRLNNNQRLNHLGLLIEDYLISKAIHKSQFYKNLIKTKNTDINEMFKVFGYPRFLELTHRNIILCPIKKEIITKEQAELFIPYFVLPIHLLYHAGEKLIQEIKKETRKSQSPQISYRKNKKIGS